MKFLTSVYRQSLYKDFKEPVSQANAYNLQQVLYENHNVFGNLYKFENFRNVFGTPPVLSEFVTFITFWKGVESVIENKHHDVSLSMPDLLQKSCFVDDDYVVSMRFFRDEILKNEMSLTKSELLESINKSQQVSDLPDFWSKVFENTKKMFNEENVSVLDISNMVFTFLVKKYSGESYLESETEPLTTSLSGEGEFNTENKSSLTESPVEYEGYPNSKEDFRYEESDNSWNYEYKYRKLLFDLETSLPKFYTYYSDTKSELSESKEEIKKLMEANDIQANQFYKEKVDLLERNSYLEEEFVNVNKKNDELKKLLMEKDSEIEVLNKKVLEVTEMFNSSDSNKLAQELQVYMGRCDGLVKTNENLKSAILELESLLDTAKTERERTQEELESVHSLVTERDSLLEKLKTSDTQYYNLVEEIKKLTVNNENLASDLLNSKAQIEKYSENDVKLNNENQKLGNEIKTLKRENQLLESEYVKLREEKESISKKLDKVLGEIVSVTEQNKQLQDRVVDYDVYKESLLQLEKQLEEMNLVNVNLKDKMNDVVQENINLVAKLELMSMPSPKNATNKLMDMIEKYKNSQSPSTYESETTDYDFSDPSEQSTVENKFKINTDLSEQSTVENKLKINPDLAETRRLNTLNAIKYGLVKTNTPRVIDNIENQDLGPYVYRKTNSFPRTVSNQHEYNDENSYDHMSMKDYVDVGIQDGEEKPDILQNAVSFLTKKFNLK